MKNIVFSPPDISEKEILAVTEVLKSGWITTGRKVKEFEEMIAKCCNTKEAICLNSGTAALELSLRLLGIGEGDEVITTAYTFTATCSCIYHVGAKAILVDTLPDSYEMDPQEVEKVINKKTKAIICLDFAGKVYGFYEQIFNIVKEKKGLYVPKTKLQEKLGRIAIIADSAHSFGAMQNGKKAGEIADITCFSFHAVKNITTAEGGAITWTVDDEDIYKQCKLLSLHGQSKTAIEKNQLANWEYDIVDTYFKWNMTDIMAAIGIVQLERMPELYQKRKKLVLLYDKLFKQGSKRILTIDHYGGKSNSSGHLYPIRIEGKRREECNELIRRLAEKGVNTNVHYKPLPLLTAYRKKGYKIDDYPNAYNQFYNEITLPLHTQLKEEDIAYIVESVLELCKK